LLLPDVNVLLAGFRADHGHHRPARSFLQEARTAGAVVALSDQAMAGVLRLATNCRVFVRPDQPEAVCDYLDALLEPPGQLLLAGEMHWSRLAGLCRRLQLAGNDVPDAYLAALAMEHDAEVVTFDRGFAQYPGLRWRWLLAGS
jgi:toxin-antitoxin system PIN domain toxin